MSRLPVRAAHEAPAAPARRCRLECGLRPITRTVDVAHALLVTSAVVIIVTLAVLLALGSRTLRDGERSVPDVTSRNRTAPALIPSLSAASLAASGRGLSMVLVGTG